MLLNEIPQEQRLAYLLSLHLERHRIRRPWKSIKVAMLIGCVVGLVYYWSVIKEQDIPTFLITASVPQNQQQTIP